MRAIALQQEPAPADRGRAGERAGLAQGQAPAADRRLRCIVQVAREQVDGGAHVLDVPVALTERADEDEQMRKLVKKLSPSVEAPLDDRQHRGRS